MSNAVLAPPAAVPAGVRFDREAALGRVAFKQRVVADLIAGRITLFEAAAKFDETTPSGQPRERTCRTVIGWVDLAMADRPELAESVTGQLESELQHRSGHPELVRVQ